MVLLDADPFLNELTNLYASTRESGTVWVTLKRSSLQGKAKRKAGVEESQFRCLVRATDGKKKISTVLSAKDHHRFQMAYATVLKAHMDTLKKREKKDTLKKKEKKDTLKKTEKKDMKDNKAITTTKVALDSKQFSELSLIRTHKPNKPNAEGGRVF